MCKKKSKLFNTDITPACEYCEYGKDALEHEMVLCKRIGVVSPYFRCKKFKYSPVRRTPKEPPKLPDMDPIDFSL